MTPRSWKPDFSLADTVPDSQTIVSDTAMFDITATQVPAMETDGSEMFGGADKLADEVALLSVLKLQATVQE